MRDLSLTNAGTARSEGLLYLPPPGLEKIGVPYREKLGLCL